MNDREVLAGDWIADFEMNQHENTDGKWHLEMTSINCSPNIPQIKVYGWSERETNGGFLKYGKNQWTISANYTQNASAGINGKFTLHYIDLKGTENEVKGGLQKVILNPMFSNPLLRKSFGQKNFTLFSNPSNFLWYFWTYLVPCMVTISGLVNPYQVNVTLI